MWINKSEERLANWFSNDERQKIMQLAYHVQRQTSPIQGMHGDLHFANILYNQQTDQFKFLDPRGQYGPRTGTFGDDMYDWAKLAHDCYYGYNAIVADVPENEYVKELFIKKLKEHNLPIETILKGGLLLLATCIPLHYDDEKRQKRMMEKVENNL